MLSFERACKLSARMRSFGLASSLAVSSVSLSISGRGGQMGTVMYAAVTTKRLQSPTGESTKGSAPGLSTYVDAMAGLVPAEVLAAHAVIISYATSSTSKAGHEITRIDNRGALQVSFYALIVISAGLYLGTRALSQKRVEVRTISACWCHPQRLFSGRCCRNRPHSTLWHPRLRRPAGRFTRFS